MENLEMYIQEVSDCLYSSPIRRYIIEEQCIPFKKSIAHNVEEVAKSLEILSKKAESPIKIAVLGEVKSGKSTLVNALVENEVSEVDVLEATSRITEIVYSEKEELSYEENRIKVGLPINYLRKINIVDTPGIKSITRTNENTTMNYIQNADLILFVLDSTHLGQEDVIEAMDRVSMLGKPMVCVLNKADLVDISIEELLEYSSGEYGIYTDKFFTVSSYLQYQESIGKKVEARSTDLVVTNYAPLKSSFDELQDYIQEIYNNCEEVKNKSVISSLNALMHRDMVNHYEYLQSITMLEEEVKKHEKLLQEKADFINSKIQYEIEDWLDRVFLDDEFKYIKENISNAPKYIHESYINETIQNKKIELDEMFVKSWDNALQEVGSEIGKDIQNFIVSSNYRDDTSTLPTININSDKVDPQQLLATVGTGAVVGGAAGGTVAFYSAVLGSSASSITIGTALLSYCPPLLIAGTIGGGVAKIIYDQVKKDSRNKEIIKDIDGFIENLRYSIAEILKDDYKEASQNLVYTNQHIYENARGMGSSLYELEKIKDGLQEYVKEVKNHI